VVTTLSFDSNVILYAELEPETEKGRWCKSLIRAAPAHGVLTVQALGEVLWVVRRRDRRRSLMDIQRAFARSFELAPTTPEVLEGAAQLCQAHDFQFWDAVIWVAASGAGATVLITEDLQDGFRCNGMTALNPFISGARDRLKQLLPRL
jgi:predicted nucleic acid-binding protein